MDINQLSQLKFDERGLIPVIAQSHDTHKVLMQAYANREAVRLTLETNQAHYYSRSRQSIWRKGETSGHVQAVEDVRFDCDADALLYLVRQEGAACHTGAYSCFEAPGNSGGYALKDYTVLYSLQETVAGRRSNPQEGSYTTYLFTKGLDKILKKVGEETAEVIIAAKNQSKDELRYETADLLYHLTVLLTDAGISWQDIFDELKGRQK